MITFHAVMLDETRCEFGVTIEAKDHDEAYHYLEDSYPESQCIQLESPEDTADRKEGYYRRMLEEENGDFRQWDYEQEWGH